MEHRRNLKSASLRSLTWLALFLVAVCVTVQAYALVVDREGDRPLPPLFGNFPRIQSVLENQPEKEGFTFAVVGDTKSTGTFEALVEELRNEPLDFAVLLGDCTYTGTEEAHRYFRAECEAEYNLDCPVFYVVGNHDVDETTFPVSRFEADYGPSVFSFEYQDCLFIVLRILNPPFTNEVSLEFLRDLLNEDTERFRKRFVFMHIPPPLSDFYAARKYPSSAELVDLLSALKVDYAIAGDYHGYAQVEFGPTSYVVTGGGGARLADDRGGQFHHAVLLRVDRESVSQRIVAIPRRVDVEDVLEKMAIVDIHPWMARNKALAGCVNAFLIVSLILLCRRCFRRTAGTDRDPVQPSSRAD